MDAEAAVTAPGMTTSRPQRDAEERMAAVLKGRTCSRTQPHSDMHVSASTHMMVRTCADRSGGGDEIGQHCRFKQTADATVTSSEWERYNSCVML